MSSPSTRRDVQSGNFRTSNRSWATWRITHPATRYSSATLITLRRFSSEIRDIAGSWGPSWPQECTGPGASQLACAAPRDVGDEGLLSRRCPRGPAGRPETSQAEAEKRERTRLRNRGGHGTSDVKMPNRSPLPGVTIESSCSNPATSRGSGDSGRFPPLRTLKSVVEKTARMKNCSSSGFGEVIVSELQAVEGRCSRRRDEVIRDPYERRDRCGRDRVVDREHVRAATRYLEREHERGRVEGVRCTAQVCGV